MDERPYGRRRIIVSVRSPDSAMVRSHVYTSTSQFRGEFMRKRNAAVKSQQGMSMVLVFNFNSLPVYAGYAAVKQNKGEWKSVLILLWKMLPG